MYNRSYTQVLTLIGIIRSDLKILQRIKGIAISSVIQKGCGCSLLSDIEYEWLMSCLKS